MADEGIDILVVAGNPWRCDYLRFAADVTPVEGHAFAFIDREGPARIITEHPAEARRLRSEQAELDVRWSLSAIEETETAIRELGKRRIALAPRLLPWRQGEPPRCRLREPRCRQRRRVLAYCSVLRALGCGRSARNNRPRMG